MYSLHDAECSSRSKLPVIKKSDQQNTWQGNTHLGVCDEDRWWAGSVQDFTAADFPDATPDVWIVPAQNLRTEEGKDGRRADFYSFSVQALSLFMRKYDFVLQNFDGV